MTNRAQELAVELLGLPASDRAFLAKQLLSSLDESDRSDSQRLWIETAEKRRAEIRDGKVECIPADEVFDRATRELRR